MPDPTQPIPGTVIPNAPAHDPSSEPEHIAAALRVEAEVDAVSDDELVPVNRDIGSVYTTVLGAYRLAQPYFAELDGMPKLDVARIRKLHDYACALYYWGSSSKASSAPKPELLALIEQGITTRQHLLDDLKVLANHGYLDRSLFANFGGSIAHRDLAMDLAGLAALVHREWPALEGKTLLTLAAMDDVSILGNEIMKKVADREFATAEKARDLVRRNKAYTLVLRTYDDLRNAIAFLRRAEGDADTIAPSLFNGRTPTKKKDEVPGATTGSAGAGAASDLLGPKTSSMIVPDNAGA